MAGENTPDPAVEAEARSMGWRPLEEYAGDPSTFRDAATFVQRGKEFLPIVKSQNRKLEGEVATLRQQLTEAQAAIAESQDAMKGLQEFYTEDSKRRVEDARRGLAAAIKEARESGDTDAELALLDQLTDLKAVEKAAATKATAPAPSPAPRAAPRVDPEFGAWAAQNPWFGQDERRTALALAEAKEMRKDPQYNDLTGAAFFDAVKEKVDQFFAPSPRGTSKVGGGGGPSSNAPPSGKTYADLPAEAKDACERQATRLVGPNRAFKDIAAWRAQYAKTYFEE